LNIRNSTGTCLVCLCLIACALGCSRFAQRVGGKADLFTGDNAAAAVAAIKAKSGGPVNVIRVEMHTDKLEIEVQSPKNPKDIDKYTYENGNVTSQPVQVMQIGNLSMTGDKYGTTPIDEIGWANISSTAKRAIEVSKLESAHIDLISMDAESVTQGSPELKDQIDKETEAKKQACLKSRTPGQCLFNMSISGPLVLTWRLFVEGPRGRKDFWADKTGKLNEGAF
jgi:hypothetical protein